MKNPTLEVCEIAYECTSDFTSFTCANGEYIDTFTSGLAKVNFWNRKQDTNLVLDHECHIEFGFFGHCASLALLPGLEA